jgi:PAS domain S-box-containing protein
MPEQAQDAAADLQRRKRWGVVMALIVALLIFALDLLSPVQGAVAVLYIVVILLVARANGQHTVLATGFGCALLALIAFAPVHLGDPVDSAYVRLGVSLVAIAAATLLSVRDHSARSTLAEQARLLELSHDTVIIRDAKGKIIYWNDGAEQLYGWMRAEALGRQCGDLLQCEFPTEIIDAALSEAGSWSGEVIRTRRDGTRIVLASRWLLRRDQEGKGVGVIESSADVTEQKRADAERLRSERRYATIFQSAGFAIWEADWSGTLYHMRASAPDETDMRTWLINNPLVVREAIAQAITTNINEETVTLFGADNFDQLLGQSVTNRFAPGTEPVFAEILSALANGEETVEKELRYLTLQGQPVDVVLRVRLLAEGEPWSRVLVMALDVTERNQARAKIEETSAELAHAARISTLGQLAASIAHEVNQPLSAIITYGKSGKRWLSRDVPDLEEVTHCLDHIVANGSRAADVISRVRSLARKATPEVEALLLEDVIGEAVSLIEREARSAQVIVQRSCCGSVRSALGDKVQVQQVLVNLLMNGIQAMRDVDVHRRNLLIRIEADGDDLVRIAVHDSGTGIDGDPSRVFDPFFTTKTDGMGMGLSICRSIIEAQGGRISASNNDDFGATFAFTLPAKPADHIGSEVIADTSV